MYCLWLNGKKISSPSEILTNYDCEALRGYFLGGSLIKWLKMAGDEETAKKVNCIDVHGDIDKELAESFGLISPERKVENIPEVTAQPAFPNVSSSFSASGSFNEFLTSFSVISGSFPFLSSVEAAGSFSPLSSFAFKSLSGSSFSIGGSFGVSSSFNSLSSFSALASFSSSFMGAGSFSVQSSFDTTSFGYGSFVTIKAIPEKQVTEEEKSEEAEAKPLTPEEKIIINLSSCPLNRFGYGIHLL